jgi:phosphoribosylformimino-5-aminoimidazole carboxamide ribotide isomerase
MLAIPSVDLNEGAMGALESGSPIRPTGVRAARALADLGFSRLHLEKFGSGSRNGSSLPTVEEIVRDTDAQIQVAGSNSVSEIERLFRSGAEYIVAGDRSIEEPEWLERLARLYPEAILVQTDLRDRRVVRRGWVRTLPFDIVDLVDELGELPLAGILVAGFDLNGASRHSDLAMIDDLAERSRSPILVSARIDSVDDLRALEHRGAAGAIVRSGSLLSGALDPHAIATEFGG